ncbi:ABC transporter substrate-binding protein [Nocardioides sp. Kera G14]|uniref:ABC transporter substrate-binding protein n=1 Tax=Nocardioides sp. Kera G14 TaxID=2884264 RepID=UPI001D0F6902|nr:ABC transporter substrate-binding protein [Nocardioides sp. Kera G14]UDY22246.1 ABC transporter substrate-binding protein [Nocardioides sp. Kera G14]
MLRYLRVALLLLILFVPAACGGSQMSPQAVRAANDAVAGGTAGGAAVADAAGGTTTDGTAAGGVTDPTAGSGAAAASGGGAAAPAASGGGAAAAAGGTGGAKAGAAAPGKAGGAAAGAVGSCAGFANGPGITSSTITLGNASDISGPVPGLFTAAQQAVKAYIAYFNSTSSICGRKLALEAQDTRTDGGGDQQAYQTLCSKSFAAIGSMSAFDSGGAATAQSCGLPDLRAGSTTNERAACTTCYASMGSNAAYFENAPMTHFIKTNKAATQAAAMVYLDAGGAAQNAQTVVKVGTKLGMKWVYNAGIGVTEFNYGPYVQAMKSKGVKYVWFFGAYQNTVRLQQAMQQADFKPEIFIQDPTIYDPSYVSQAGAAGEGTYVYMNFVPFSQASSNPEMSTYLKWLQQVAPGANPTFYGVMAWSAAALFVKQAQALGGKLTRASFLNSLKSVTNWTAGGMTAPQNVGGKMNGSCWRFIQLKGGKWNSLGGYECDGVTKG